MTPILRGHASRLGLRKPLRSVTLASNRAVMARVAAFVDLQVRLQTGTSISG